MNKLFQTMTAPAANDQVMPKQGTRAREDVSKICVRDLRLEMSIGVYDHEKTALQPVVINIDLWVVTPDHAPSSMEDVVCYEDMVNKVQAIADRGHIEMVEAFAEDIARACLSYPQSQKILIKIEKTDIMPQTASVGVEILRHK